MLNSGGKRGKSFGRGIGVDVDRGGRRGKGFGKGTGKGDDDTWGS